MCLGRENKLKGASGGGARQCWGGAIDSASKSKQQLSMGQGLGPMTPGTLRALTFRRWGNIARKLSGPTAGAIAASQVAVLLVPVGCIQLPNLNFQDENSSLCVTICF